MMRKEDGLASCLEAADEGFLDRKPMPNFRGRLFEDHVEPLDIDWRGVSSA